MNDLQTVPNGSASIVRQEFGATSVQHIRETAQASMVAQARAAVEAMFVVARANPRSWDDVRVKLLAECRRPAFAKAAWFRKPQGSGFVEGLSVRFAETALRLAGNLRRGTRTTYEDDQKRQLNIFVVDCETNSETSRDITIDKTVERKNTKGRVALQQRINSAGDTVFIVASTEDEMMAKEGAIVSKVGRVLILQMIPGDILDECRDQIQQTRSNEDAKDPGAARKALADAFASLSVMPLDLARYLGHDIAQCTPVELEDLRGIYAAIRDGEASWAEVAASKSSGAEQETTSSASASDQAAGGQPSAADAPKGRGSRLASRVRGTGGAVQPAAATATTPAVEATQPMSVQQPIQPVQQAASQTQGAARPSPEQTSLLGSTPATVPASTTPTAPAADTVVVPPAARPAITEDERKARLAAQVAIKSSWGDAVGVRVVVELAGGQTLETHTTTMARMFGEIAVVNVDGIEGPVALTQITRLAK
jgi:hypothetical protein